MKFRYIIGELDSIKGQNEISRDDLVKCKNGYYDFLIDLQNMTYFDHEQNEWVEINGK